MSSHTYYPTVIYDMPDIRKSFLETLMVQLLAAEQESSIELASVEGIPGLKAFAPARPGPRAPTEETVKRFDDLIKSCEDVFINNTTAMRELFENGHTLMLLGGAIPKDEYGLECVDVNDSLKNELVDEIQIMSDGKILMTLQEEEWTIGESDNYLSILEQIKPL